MGHPRKMVVIVSILALCTVLVAGQLEAIDSRDPFKFVQSTDDHTEPTTSRKSFYPGGFGTSSNISNSSSDSTGARRRNASLLGFGSDCSAEKPCNALLGLACLSHESHQSPRCACAPSSPVYVSKDGVQRCVRAKGILEACVSHQECSFNNPNVQCIDFRCNCSHPFALTPGRLCQLPLTKGGDVLTVALSVMFALALLVVAGGYTYQKRVRERDRSRNSWMPGRSRYTESSSASSMTRMLDKAGRCAYSDDDRGDLDSKREGVGDERLRARLSQPTLHQDTQLPRHPPRYISQKAANLKELDSGKERYKPRSGGMGVPRGSPPHRTRKGRHATGKEKRKTEAALVRTEQEFSSSFPVQLMKPKDEHMRKILIDEQKVVVTVEAHRGRSSPLGRARSPPPVMFLRRTEAPPSESTDDSFMKELKLRRFRKAHHMGDLTDTLSTASAEPPRPTEHQGYQKPEAVPEAIVSYQKPSATASTQAAAVNEQKKPVTGQPSAGVALSSDVPTKKHDAAIKPVQQEQNPSKSLQSALDSDKSPQAGQKLHVKVGILEPLTQHYERTTAEKNEVPCDIARRASSPPVIMTIREADAQAPASISKVRPRRPSQSEHYIVGNSVQNSPVPAEAAGNNKSHELDAKESLRPSPPPHCINAATQPESSKRNTRTKQNSEFSPQNAIKGVQLDVGPNEMTNSGTDKSLKSKDGLKMAGAQKQQSDDTDYMSIDEVGRLARLLSGLIRKHGKKSGLSSVEDATTSETDGVEEVAKFRSDFGVAPRVGATNVSPPRKSDQGAFENATDSIRGNIKQKNVKNRLPLPTSEDLPEIHRKTLHPTQQGTVRTTAFMYNASAPMSFVLQHSGTTSFSPLPEQYGTGQEAIWDSWTQIGDDWLGERKPVACLSLAGQSAILHVLSPKNADEAKSCTIRPGGSTPEPIPAGAPQGYPGRVATTRAAYATQTAFNKQGSAGRVLIERITEHEEPSLTSAGAGGPTATSSTASETTQSSSIQPPHQEHMTRQLRPPEKFAERPFADVLASLESETSSLRGDDRKEVINKVRNIVNRAPAPSTPQSSSQSCMNDKGLDKAAIEHSSKEADEGVLSQAIGSKQDGDASSSPKVRAAAAAPSSKILRSAKSTTTTTVDSDEGSREVPRALLTFYDSDHGSMPASLSFASSDSGCSVVPHLSDLPRLEQSSAGPSTLETGNGVVHSVAPEPLFSIATQTESSRPPNSSRGKRGAQVQLLPSPRGFWPQLKKVRKRDVGPRVRTDSPWTEDVKKVVMLGNKYYLQQHALRRRAMKSASTLDETQYVLFQIQDQTHPASSRLALEGPGSMPDEMSPGSHETMQDMLIRCSTLSSGRDIDTSISEANYEPLKLKDLVMLQHPDVGLKNIHLVELSERDGVPPRRSLSVPSSEEDTEQQKGLAVEPEDAVARDYKEHQKTDTAAHVSEPALEKAGLTSNAAGARPKGVFQTTVPRQKQRGKSSKDFAQRSSIIKPLVKIGTLERKLEQEAVPSRKAVAAVTKAAGSTAIRFIGPFSSQSFAVMPDRAVPVCLQSGKGIDVPPRQLAGVPLRPSKLMTLAESRHRQILLARALEEPSFESIYNAILQSSPATAPELSGVPGDVPCSPERPASSSRSVCFDDSLTVVTLEPPPEPNECGAVGAESMLPPLWLQLKKRRRSSGRRASPGSRPQTPATEGAAASCEATKTRGSGLRRPALHEPGPPPDFTAEADGGVSETRSGGRASRRKSRSPLMSPFYSFEDTGSELSFLPDSTNFDWNDSGLASQRSYNRHEGPRGGEKATAPIRSNVRPR